jgi:putative redox protein
MRKPPSAVSVEVDGELADDHPRRFIQIVMRYRVEGHDLPEKNLRRAVALSEQKYCGIWATLAPTVELSSEIWLNGEQLPAQDADPPA